MATTEFGDNLFLPILQPGWTVSCDGFGLVQIKAQFRWNRANWLLNDSSNLYFSRGHIFDVAPYRYCRMFKWDYVEEKNNIVLISAEYVGIEPQDHTTSGGFITDAQVQMVGSASAEDISHHPNFIQVNCISNGLLNELAGPPPPGGIFEKDSFINPNRALWSKIVINQGALNDCQFVGFLPSNSSDEGDINIKAGIKSYYKPQSTLRVMIYVSSDSDSVAATMALTKASYVGWTTNGRTFNLPEEYRKLAEDEAYPGNFKYKQSYNDLINRSFLVTNCSVERFGYVYKVTADLMLSGIAGWDKDIYPSIKDEI